MGQNLFGVDAFGARVGLAPPDDILPAVHVDMVAAVGGISPQPFHKGINIVQPPEPIRGEPCQIALQFNLGSDGTISGIVNRNVLFDFRLVEGTPTGNPFCAAPPDDN